MVAYERLKTKENLKLLALKVVVVVYENWSLKRGSKYSDLTGTLLVVWKIKFGLKIQPNAWGNYRILYHKTNKEASTVLCSVVKHLRPVQTPLHSCAEPNLIKFDFRATLEQRLIQMAYLRRI